MTLCILAVYAVVHLIHRTPIVRHARHLSKQRAWALDLRLALLVLFGLVWIAQRAGTAVLVAGFGVGLMVAAIGGPKRLSRQVTGVAQGLMVPLFFVVLGARLDLRALFDDPSLIALAAELLVLNLVVHATAALLTRQPFGAGLAATAQLGVPAAVVTLGLQQADPDERRGGRDRRCRARITRSDRLRRHLARHRHAEPDRSRATIPLAAGVTRASQPVIL